MNKLSEIIKIADVHADRIKEAWAELKGIFPLSESDVINMSKENLILIDFLIGRFAKLQDLVGNKLIDAFFESQEEPVSNLTMIDKLNKLEKLLLIEDASIWGEMRKARNHLTHEYPDQPDLTAKFLNEAVQLIPELLKLLENIKKASNRPR